LAILVALAGKFGGFGLKCKNFVFYSAHVGIQDIMWVGLDLVGATRPEIQEYGARCKNSVRAESWMQFLGVGKAFGVSASSSTNQVLAWQ